jgi:hypothetical protein
MRGALSGIKRTALLANLHGSPPTVLKRLLELAIHAADDSLSAREMEVLRAVGQGQSNTEYDRLSAWLQSGPGTDALKGPPARDDSNRPKLSSNRLG